MTTEELLAILFAGLVMLTTTVLVGCAAAAPLAGYFTSGGVTLYKSAKESGPKAEFVLVKGELNHIVYQGQSCPCNTK